MTHSKPPFSTIRRRSNQYAPRQTYLDLFSPTVQSNRVALVKQARLSRKIVAVEHSGRTAFNKHFDRGQVFDKTVGEYQNHKGIALEFSSPVQ